MPCNSFCQFRSPPLIASHSAHFPCICRVLRCSSCACPSRSEKYLNADSFVRWVSWEMPRPARWGRGQGCSARAVIDGRVTVGAKRLEELACCLSLCSRYTKFERGSAEFCSSLHLTTCIARQAAFSYTHPTLPTKRKV